MAARFPHGRDRAPRARRDPARSALAATAGLSPATAQLDAKVKRRLYARRGCKALWLVDPLLLQVQIYDFARDTAKPTRLIAEHEKFTTKLLPGLTLSAKAVFKHRAAMIRRGLVRPQSGLARRSPPA